MATWFISDLHLDAAQPEIITLLHDFLRHIQGDAEALYILGDLFEYWVGDDALATPYTAAFAAVISAVRAASERGIKLYFQHGNRDFLIGDAFAAATGCTLLPESTVVDLYGAPTLLLHGDTLCSDDVAYQQVRKRLRDPQWQHTFLALPLAERIRQAQAMRAQSQAMQQAREYLVDVNQHTVQAVLQAAGVRYLIHGHTHRPAIHEWQVEGLAYQRIVLGAWHADSASFLRVDANGVELSY